MKLFQQCECCGHVSQVRTAMVGELLGRYIGRNKKATPTQIADFLGVSRQAVHLWIANKTSPSEDKFKQVIRYLAIPDKEVAEFMNG